MNHESKQEFFSSRWALIIATIGIAVGTGNIWRFSRVVAQNGGGSFLIPWVIFLLIWSVPLIIAEFAIGKSSRMGPVGAFAKTAGKQFGWMGAWIVFVSTAIMFYYSVVTGWCIRYFFSAASGSLFNTSVGISHQILNRSFQLGQCGRGYHHFHLFRSFLNSLSPRA